MALFGQVGSFPDDVVLTVFYLRDESRPLRINGNLNKIAYGHRVGACLLYTSWPASGEEYHSDEALRYYIYRNGQCQESCRDQGHTMGGIGNYTAIAEMAWNQGDSLYGWLDNRILKGIEFNIRYNLSGIMSFPDQMQPWEPTAYTANEEECTFENGKFYQAVSRSKRWEAKSMRCV